MRTDGRVAGIAASLAALAAAAILVHGGAARAGARSLEAEPAPARVHDAARAAVRRAASTYAELERVDVEMLGRELDALIADPQLVALFRARDREKLLKAAQPRFAELKARRNITHWYFLDAEPARTCFLRVHAPALHGDVIQRETLSQAIATKRIGHGKELGKTAFALRVVKPVRSGGTLLGYMELGEEIDHFLGRMKAVTGDDFGLLVDKARIDRKELARVRGEDRWDERRDVVLVESTLADARQVDIGVPLVQLGEDGHVLGAWREGASSYASGAFPVRDAANRVVGALFVRHRVDL